jgi:hypothetical protein
MFGMQIMPDSNPSAPAFIWNRSICLTNAGSGIWLLVHHLAPRQVWCPSYLCYSILEAIQQCSIDIIRFYEASYDLTIPSYDWLDQVDQGDLVILIDYFGFACDSICAAKAKERGAWVLEDASQALLSDNVSRYSDFVLYSPRKFVGVPDGGVLCISCDINLPEVTLDIPPMQWWLDAFAASLLRRESDIYGGAQPWFDLFQKTENTSPIGGFAMSELSKALLLSNFDYSTIAMRRVENYRYLTGKLGFYALFPNLPERTVPLGFPIRTQKRDEIRQTLFTHEIYPPVHWPIQGLVPAEYSDSHKLAQEIMTLPCDQRYSESDMERMVKVIVEVLE